METTILTISPIEVAKAVLYIAGIAVMISTHPEGFIGGARDLFFSQK